MGGRTNLEELKKALFQQNKALKKRALAVIHNDVVTEAIHILREFMGVEEDSELQVLALKVFKKLQEFSRLSSQVSPNALVPLLQSTDPEHRILALRALAGRRMPGIAQAILSNCQSEDLPEAMVLIADILVKNPDLRSLSLLFNYSSNSDGRLRARAVDGIRAILDNCILPMYFTGLSDADNNVKIASQRAISPFNNMHILGILDSMLQESEGERPAIAGAVLKNFLCPEAMPVLRRHSSHVQTETAERVREAITEARGRGFQGTEHSAVAPAQPAEKPQSSAGTLASRVKDVWEDIPYWLPGFSEAEELSSADKSSLARRFYHNVRYFLTYSFVSAYFLRGNRSPAGDRFCLRTVLTEFESINTPAFLKIISSSFPDPAGAGDFFPVLMAFRLRCDDSDSLLEPLNSMDEALQFSDDYSNADSSFYSQLSDGMVGLVQRLLPFFRSNLVIAKQATDSGVKAFSHWGGHPRSAERKFFDGFQIPLDEPVLVGGDSVSFLPLAPFFTLDAESGRIRLGNLTQSAINRLVSRYSLSQTYIELMARIQKPD